MFSRLSAAFAVAFITLVFSSPGFAGCPAYPPELAGIEVQECRFYDATQDAALVEKVQVYFEDNWKGEESKKRIAKTLVQNTGVIISGKQNGDTADGKTRDYFYRTEDKSACEKFQPQQSYIVNLHRTCRMVFFEAPTGIVLTLASEDGGLEDVLFEDRPLSERAVPVAPPPAVHVDDAAVLAWAEDAVKKVFAKGLRESDENPYPEYFTAEGWNSFREELGGAWQPVDGGLGLKDAIIVQKLTGVIGPDNVWVVEWDCDFPVAGKDGKPGRAGHISLLIHRTAAESTAWAISGIDISWHEGETGAP